MNKKTMPDKTILSLIDKNADKGMRVLMQQYTPLVYSVVRSRLSACMSSNDIEETVSDVFIAFYRQRQKVNTQIGSLAAYLTVIAKNKSADMLRLHGRQISVCNDAESMLELPDSFDLQREAERNALHRRLIEEINALGEPDSTIVYRRYFLGESSKEVALYLKMTDSNVRKRLSRALRRLEKNLKGDYYNED